jgi:hypothetical protein
MADSTNPIRVPASPAWPSLVLSATIIVGLSRFVDGPTAWFVAVLALVMVGLGTAQTLADADARAGAAGGVPVEHLIAPATAALAAVGAIRLVPIGLLLPLGLAAVGWLEWRILATEARLLAAPGGATPGDRTAVLVQALVIGFLGFTGVAALVPGGLAEPGVGGASLAGANLTLLAGADGVIALLLGYRATALRTTQLREVAISALTFGAVVAIAAAALRAMAVPRLVGPALLALVFFLWHAIHGAPPGRRRDARRLWEIILLVILFIVVVAWGLQLRGG